MGSWAVNPDGGTLSSVTRGVAAADLVNAIFAYAIAGAFVLWLIWEDRERRSRVLDLSSATSIAQLLIGKDRGYQWWISGFVLVVLAAVGFAVVIACSGRSSPAHHLTAVVLAVDPPLEIALRGYNAVHHG